MIQSFLQAHFISLLSTQANTKNYKLKKGRLCLMLAEDAQGARKGCL
jgi:hypothetical protein